MKRSGDVSEWKVLVFVPGDGPDYEVEGIWVHHFQMKWMPSNIFPFIFEKCNQASFLMALERVGVDVQEVKICHGNTAEFSIYPNAVKKLNPNCLTLLHHHDLSSFGFAQGRLRNAKWYRFIQSFFLRKRHREIDCHVFISTVARMHFIEDSNWTPRWSYILHNGVNIDLFTRGSVSHHKIGSVFTIGTIGNILKDGVKDFPCIARAFAKLVSRVASLSNNPKVCWKIVGSGNGMEALKRLISDLGIQKYVDFVPEMDHNQLPRFYQSLDLFVLPSWWEGFGCVYTEAYACGVPFIACSENNGIVDLAPGDWLIKAHDAIALFNKMHSMYRMREDDLQPLLPLKGEYRILPLVDRFLEGLKI